MNYIIFFTTHWGYIEGGINSFNFDLCIHLGKVTKNSNYQVVCITLFDPPNSLVIKANENNVAVHSLAKKTTDFSLQDDIPSIKRILKTFINVSSMYLIGHDVFTGEITNYLSNDIGENSFSIVFHHMDYEAYYSIKGDSSINQVDQKITKQKDILSFADAIIAVGPKLENSALGKSRAKIFKIIPGLPEIETWESNKKFVGITFGRYDARTDKLKQMGLAAKAFTNFVEKNRVLAGRDATLKIIGIDKEKDREDIENLSKMHSNGYVNILSLPYKSDRKKLLTELSQANVCLMLSVHEGFGLVGLEAIAAGVPLVLSENSGLYEFLTEEIGSVDLKSNGIYSLTILGTNDGSLNQEDLKNVEKAIAEIRQDNVNFRKGILLLKNKIRKKYSWEHCSSVIIKILKKVQKEISETRNKQKAEIQKTELILKDTLYVDSVTSVEKHADMWRWDQRMFKSRHFNALKDFDLVSLELGRSWWKRYPKQDWVLRNWEHEQIGQYCLCPIKENIYEKLINGLLIETNIGDIDIVDTSKIKNHKFWYLSNFMKAKVRSGIKGLLGELATHVMINHIVKRALTSNHFATHSGKEISIVTFIEAKSINKTAEYFRFRKAHPHTTDSSLEKVYYSVWTSKNLGILLEKTENFIEQNINVARDYQKKNTDAFIQPPNY